MKNRRYIVSFDNRLMNGTTLHWPKARAIARADAIVRHMGGAAVVGRMNSDGVYTLVHEAYEPEPVPLPEREEG